jgi:hypothetical protein
MTTYQIGTSIGTLADADTVFGVLPASQYNPGREVTTHAGTMIYRGYPRSTWVFNAIAVSVWDTVKTTYLAGALSGETYITTRDDDDDWDSYRTIMTLPNPAGLRRWGEKYLDVKIEFVLVEAP